MKCDMASKDSLHCIRPMCAICGLLSHLTSYLGFKLDFEDTILTTNFNLVYFTS